MTITPEAEAAFIKRLEACPVKTRSNKETSQDLVIKHYPTLKAAYDRGNSYEELAPIFYEYLDVSIRPETLRKYMSHAKKQRAVESTSEKDLSASTQPKPSTSKPSRYQTQTKSLSPERKESILSNRASEDITNEFPNL